MKKALTLLSTISLSVLISACSHNNDSTMQPQAMNRPSDDQMKQWNSKQQEHMRKVSEYFFNEMDTNEDGYVSYKEFMTFQRNIFHEADANHDGKLTLQEFIGEGKRQKSKMHEWKEEHQGERNDHYDNERTQRDDDRDDAGQNEGYNEENNSARSGNYGGQRHNYDENSESGQ